MIATKPPPALLDEARLIGCLVTDYTNTMVPRLLSGGIEPSSFSDPYLSRVCDEAYKIFADNRIVDLFSLSAALRQANVPEHTSLQALADDAGTAQFGPHYVNRVKRWAQIRRIRSLLTSLGVEAERIDADEVPEFTSVIQQRICQVGTAEEEIQSTADLARSIIADARQPPETRPGIPWPWEHMARQLDPITDELIYIASRPGVGKTALALNIATAAAFGGHRVGFASLESSRRKIVRRLLQSIGQISLKRMTRNPATAHWQDAEVAIDKLESLPIGLTHNGMTCEQLFAWGKSERAKGAELLIVDNMKHVRPSQKYTSTVEQFRDISARLKWMRDDLDMPIIILHHLSREEKLSWSDDIERDADMVFFMGHENDGNWLNYQTATQENGWTQSVKIELRKNRDDVGGTFRMELNGEWQLFSEARKGPGEENH